MLTLFWVLEGTILASSFAMGVLTIADAVKIQHRRSERPPSFARETDCGNPDGPDAHYACVDEFRHLGTIFQRS
ncbi:MAG TPA: hypothetical protein VMG82_35295 [Candidatus Sulfotelmatobacter sp.]|nr:hypothetical protein [Candidatus Sulfotelmatobacter sp.]